MNNEQIWQASLGELELTLSKANFTTWFKNTQILYGKDGEFVIGVPNAFAKEWLKNKYNKQIVKALQNVANVRIKKISYELTSQRTNQLKTSVFTPSFIRKETRAPAEQESAFDINSKYTFENFVVGKNNELARAAASAITKNPGITYNPLFIYGGVGLGKTHLIQAIGNEILKDKKEKVIYVSCEKFMEDFINFIQHEKGKANNSSFKNKYRTADFLLIDDIQFLSGKEGTQEEFFHTFNTLYQKNRQIVLTSDRPPKAIAGLEDRLVSRFEGGMVADITTPDLETRRAILFAKCKEKKVEISEDVLNYIAHNIQNNIRELEGALSKVIAHCQLHCVAASETVVKTILTNIITNPNRKALTPRRIIEIVSQFYNIKPDELMAKDRRKEIAWPRQIAMHLMRSEGKISYPTIGNELGGRDHTTAIHACEKVSHEIEKDDNIRREIEAIRQQLLQFNK
jgi:chromosomal replication initiator protein